jgi:putative tricarboxylic transport membrane protein
MGVVLGKLLEESMRQALAISGGDFRIFVSRPLAAGLLLASALVLVVPILWQGVRRRRRAA